MSRDNQSFRGAPLPTRRSVNAWLTRFINYYSIKFYLNEVFIQYIISTVAHMLYLILERKRFRIY